MVGLLGAIIIIIGGAAGHYTARRKFEAMSAAQAQQAQINQAQRQAAQAAQAAQAPSQGKKHPYQKLLLFKCIGVGTRLE
jgi:membrane protease subunit (stomatin/prohibitin family)